MKVLAGTLSLVVPVAASAAKLAMDDAVFKGIEKQLDLGQKSLDSVITLGGNVGTWLGKGDAPDLEHGREIRADGSTLRQLQSWLKEKDPGFGGLIKVQNKRREFLWVHPQSVLNSSRLALAHSFNAMPTASNNRRWLLSSPVASR